VGIILALNLISRSNKVLGREDMLFLVVSTIILMLWMYVYYKVYDVVAALVLVALFAYLLERPSARRYFFLGIGIGFVATIGRNHGVYAMVACAGAIGFVNAGKKEVRAWVEHLPALAAGIAVGFAPVWIALLAVDGFARAFTDSIYYLFEIKATNLPLPVPWPWSNALLAMPPGLAVHGFFAGLCFVALLVFPLASLQWIVRARSVKRPLNPAFVATVLLSVPYAHYAFSRADVPHLSFAIFPMLMGCLLLLHAMQSRFKWFLLAGIAGTSALLMLPLQPAGKCFIVYRCVEVDVVGDLLRVPEKKASEIRLLKALVAQYAPAGGGVWVTPSWPGAYSLLGQKAPVYDNYTLLKRSDSFQNEEIARLVAAKPGLVVVVEEALDGGDKHFLQYTNPLVYAYLNDHFVEVLVAGYPTVKAYRAK
jgi:hypothetical protein